LVFSVYSPLAQRRVQTVAVSILSVVHAQHVHIHTAIEIVTHVVHTTAQLIAAMTVIIAETVIKLD
jgi:hypothetical protein